MLETETHYHVSITCFRFGKILPPPPPTRFISLARRFSMFSDVVLVWRFRIIFLKIIWRKSTIVSIFYIDAETRLWLLKNWRPRAGSRELRNGAMWKMVKNRKKILRILNCFFETFLLIGRKSFGSLIFRVSHVTWPLLTTIFWRHFGPLVLAYVYDNLSLMKFWDKH